MIDTTMRWLLIFSDILTIKNFLCVQQI